MGARTGARVRVRVRLIAGRQHDDVQGPTLRSSTGTVGTAQAAYHEFINDPAYPRRAWILIEPLTLRPRWVMDALCAGSTRALRP